MTPEETENRLLALEAQTIALAAAHSALMLTTQQLHQTVIPGFDEAYAEARRRSINGQLELLENKDPRRAGLLRILLEQTNPPGMPIGY